MFEIVKEKSKARKIRREAIDLFEEYIRDLTIGLLKISDADERKSVEEEIARVVAIREVLKKKQEPPKWLCTVAETSTKIGGIVLTMFLKEKMMNAGTGDKIISNGMDQIIRS